MKSWECPYCYRCPFLKNKNGDKITTAMETLFERLQSIENCNDTEFKNRNEKIDSISSNFEIIKKSVDNKENKDITKWTQAIKENNEFVSGKIEGLEKLINGLNSAESVSGELGVCHVSEKFEELYWLVFYRSLIPSLHQVMISLKLNYTLSQT